MMTKGVWDVRFAILGTSAGLETQSCHQNTSPIFGVEQAAVEKKKKKKKQDNDALYYPQLKTAVLLIH